MTEQPEAASPEIARNADAGIVELATPNGAHQGMGILVGPRHVLTCAHVVNTALGRKAEDLSMPVWSDAVWVSFPFAVRPARLIGRVIEWRPVGSLRGDLAVLQLDRGAPLEVGIAILAWPSNRDLSDHVLSVFGKAAGAIRGVRVGAAFMGKATSDWRQIGGVDNSGVFVRGGYSGAAVWDTALKASVGMVVARYVSESEKIAFMISIGEFADLWRDAPMEKRNAPPGFEPVWTWIGFITLVLMLAHWAVDRGARVFAPLSIGGPHGRLSAFWGMHLGAVLPGLLACLLYWHARSFHLHAWFARVPRLGLALRVPDGSASKAGGVVTLFVMLLLFGLQIHFVRRFNVEGHVYIYPTAFGYTADEYRATPDTQCSPGLEPLCTRSVFSRYSLVLPKKGTSPGYWASYWNNAYHYGDWESERDRTDGGGTVTFFPILQPIIIIALTATELAIAAAAIATVFGRRPSVPLREGPSTDGGQTAGV